MKESTNTQDHKKTNVLRQSFEMKPTQTLPNFEKTAASLKVSFLNTTTIDSYNHHNNPRTHKQDNNDKLAIRSNKTLEDFREYLPDEIKKNVVRTSSNVFKNKTLSTKTSFIKTSSGNNSKTHEEKNKTESVKKITKKPISTPANNTTIKSKLKPKLDNFKLSSTPGSHNNLLKTDTRPSTSHKILENSNSSNRFKLSNSNAKLLDSANVKKNKIILNNNIKNNLNANSKKQNFVRQASANQILSKRPIFERSDDFNHTHNQMNKYIDKEVIIESDSKDFMDDESPQKTKKRTNTYLISNFNYTKGKTMNKVLSQAKLETSNNPNTANAKKRPTTSTKNLPQKENSEKHVKLLFSANEKRPSSSMKGQISQKDKRSMDKPVLTKNTVGTTSKNKIPISTQNTYNSTKAYPKNSVRSSNIKTSTPKKTESEESKYMFIIS